MPPGNSCRMVEGNPGSSPRTDVCQRRVNPGSGAVSVAFPGRVSRRGGRGGGAGRGGRVRTFVVWHLDAVDAAFDGSGGPGEAEPGGDGIVVSTQAGDEGAGRGLAGGDGAGHPGLGQLAAAAFVHDDGEGADGGGDAGELR